MVRETVIDTRDFGLKQLDVIEIWGQELVLSYVGLTQLLMGPNNYIKQRQLEACVAHGAAGMEPVIAIKTIGLDWSQG